MLSGAWSASSCAVVRPRSSLAAFILLGLILLFAPLVWATAPVRSGQPYAEANLCARVDVILCEDFNYPQNLTSSGDPGPENWINPGLAQGNFGIAYGASSRSIEPATTLTEKPQGAMPSGSQADYVWSATGGPGSTWGYLRKSGGNYANGMPPAKDLYIRFQIFWTSDWAWPGDPKTDKYNWGSSPCYDNKILFLYPPEGVDNPTSSAYDAGAYTSCGTYDPVSNARFSDALELRVGDAGENYRQFPLCSMCTATNQHNEYAPFASLVTRNPGQAPTLGKSFRFNTGRWYTLEFRYKLSSSSGVHDGTIEAWIDGTKVYSASDLPTCGGGLGDCSGIGAIYIGAYHNGADATRWSGSQVIDNLVIATSYIGPPAVGSGGADTQAPSVPTGLTATAVSPTQIGLAWAAASDNVGVKGYQIFRGGMQVGTTPTTTYTDTGLAAGTAYTYTVAAYDTAGNTSVQSAAASATTAARDTSPPMCTLTINNGAAVTPWTAATLSLSATDNVGVTGYYLATSATPPPATAAGWVAVTATPSYSNSNVPYTLSNGDGSKTVYAWYKDAAGNVSGTASASILLDQTPPSNGTLTATPGNAQVDLSWSGFADSRSGLASSNTYKLVVSTGGAPASSCTNGTQVSVGTGTSFIHTGLANGTTYAYRVCALDKAGNISTGATASAIPQGPDSSAPTVSITVPTAAATYSTSSSTLNLSGSASDAVGVSVVTWSNNRGGSGTASGTTSWTVSGIVLQSGSNVLTVSARGTAGSTGTATLTVNYIPAGTTPPTITITYPTSNPTFRTRSKTLALGGTASDNIGVTQVSWMNNRGGSGTASGTTSWTVKGISLQYGTNVISITARDVSGNTQTITLTVTRRW